MDYGMVQHRQLGPESSEPAGDLKCFYRWHRAALHYSNPVLWQLLSMRWYLQCCDQIRWRIWRKLRMW